MDDDLIKSPMEFEWDSGNLDKSSKKHGIFPSESEEIFFNNPLLINGDASHSQAEVRYMALGKTNEEKLLFVIFTIRRNKIRIISARNMNKKERGIYEEV